MRKPLMAGNWKMNLNHLEAIAVAQKLVYSLDDKDYDAVDVAIIPPFTDIRSIQTMVDGDRLRLQYGAQDLSPESSGAFTGDISGSMLAEIGVDYVIVGHSERRQYFGDTDQTVNLRLKAAQQYGFKPILCVGETKEQRNAGETEQVIIAQLKEDLVEVDQSNLVIAYEPIWAIGTGDTCESSEANRVIGIIRQQLDNKNVSIQYGGSVNTTNADEIMAQPEIDGALVGGASLSASSFARIVNYQ